MVRSKTAILRYELEMSLCVSHPEKHSRPRAPEDGIYNWWEIKNEEGHYVGCVILMVEYAGMGQGDFLVSLMGENV